MVGGLYETGLTPLGEPIPKFFSGFDLVFAGVGVVFLQGVEVVTCKTHLLALFSAYHCYTCLTDQI